MWIFGSGKDVEVANTIRDRINLVTPQLPRAGGQDQPARAIDLMALAVGSSPTTRA